MEKSWEFPGPAVVGVCCAPSVKNQLFECLRRAPPQISPIPKGRGKEVQLESCQFPGWRLGLVTGVVGRVPGGPERLAGCPLVPGHSLLSPARSHAGLRSLRPGGEEAAWQPPRAAPSLRPAHGRGRGGAWSAAASWPCHRTPTALACGARRRALRWALPGPLPVRSSLSQMGCR